MTLRRDEPTTPVTVYYVTQAQALIELSKPVRVRDPHMKSAVGMVLELMVKGFKPIREFTMGSGSGGIQGSLGIYSYTLWEKTIQAPNGQELPFLLSFYGLTKAAPVEETNEGS